MTTNNDTTHKFYRTDVGHTICEACGLIPFDDDHELPCPGTREGWALVSRERALTDDEALTFLTLDSGRVPCSIYGRDSHECAPIAIELAHIMGREQGRPMSVELLDELMGDVVNESGDVADTLNRYASDEFRDDYAELMAEIRPRESVSSGHFSHDDQMIDAVNWLYNNHRDVYDALLVTFPELERTSWEGSWLDTDRMGVDVEFSSWVVDAIEATGLVWWEDGEPWVAADDHG